MSRWLRPGVLPWHLLVVAVVATFASLGVWQLDRHQSLRDRNDLLVQRLASAPIPFADALRDLDPDAAPGTTTDARYRPVVAVGRYLPEHEVLLRGRSLDDLPGFHVLTPLQRTDANGAVVDGPAVLVDRGWIPYRLDDPSLPSWAPPAGVIRVEGRLMPEADEPTGPLAGLAPRDPAEGPLTRIARPDVDRLQPQVPVELAPYLIELERATVVAEAGGTAAASSAAGSPVGGSPVGGTPAAGSETRTDAQLPIVPTAPAPEGGPHLSYAAQWFFFAAVAAVGYLLLLRRRFAV